jgi:acetyl-CoA C-acetyltransferase
MSNIVITAAVRSAVGSFNGAFAATPAHVLGAEVIKAALARAGVEAGHVSEVILGQVLTAGQGQNPARQAIIAAGLPQETSAYAAQVCAPWGWHCSLLLLGMRQLCWRVGRNPCRWPSMPRICAVARKWADWSWWIP